MCVVTDRKRERERDDLFLLSYERRVIRTDSVFIMSTFPLAVSVFLFYLIFILFYLLLTKSHRVSQWDGYVRDMNSSARFPSKLDASFIPNMYNAATETHTVTEGQC